jgi:uncharacterized membrane protein YfcA
LSWLDVLLVPLGFAVGAYGTLVGAGGGFILVPVLLLIYPDESQKDLTAISLFVVLANSISGSIAFARQRVIDYRTGLAFAAASVPLAFAGAYVVRFLPRSGFDVMFGILLIGLAAFTMSGLRRRVVVREPLAPGRGIVVRSLRTEEGVTYRYAFDVRRGLALSAAIGFASSLFGVGGGIMQVPAMVSILRIPVAIAVATSQFILVFMSGSGTTLHILDGVFGREDLSRALLLAAGAVPGAQAGAFLARRVRTDLIVPLLAIALALLGVRLVLTPFLS